MNIAVDSHNLVSSDEVFNIIETSAKNLIDNPDMAMTIPAIMLRGAPGVGKSTIVRSVAEKLGIGFIELFGDVLHVRCLFPEEEHVPDYRRCPLTMV